MLNTTIPIETLNKMNRNTMMDVLGIEYTEVGENYICAKMPVDKRTHQPVGLLHGGATAALAETLGSLGSTLVCNPEEYSITGIEVNANHIKGVREGYVHAKSTLIHCGRTMHVWNTEVKNDKGELVAICRLTVLVLPRKK
jgi:1,4-dihydroxy-2-naphthoyl-CoA hydrolase